VLPGNWADDPEHAGCANLFRLTYKPFAFMALKMKLGFYCAA
jgi:hypothetical protein